ncbi:MAG TPA: AP2 domain-containing protein, partial [Nitrososphaeraceae archaeon]
RTVQSRNTRVLYSTNTSGYRGVYFHKARKLWSSCIRINGKSKTIGYFNTAIESAIAYDSFVIRNNLEHTLNGVELYLT